MVPEVHRKKFLLYTGGLFHCHMLDESICHFRGVGSILSLLLIQANNIDPDQTPHQCLHCLHMTLLPISR